MEQTQLFKDIEIEIFRKKKIGTITISESTFKTNLNEEGYRLIKFGERATHIDFCGYNEGKGYAYTDTELKEKSVEERVMDLKRSVCLSKEYNYTIKIVDERITLCEVQQKVL